MTSPELVAMIPVKEEFARNTKHWNMPFLCPRPSSRKTNGRVFRADKSLELLKADAAKRAGKPGELSQRDWGKFLSRVIAGSPSKYGEGQLSVGYYAALS
ncbi:hypothetical protein I6F14_08825 [Bradyrhizobium sp. IC3069]|uniref:hypothetical protein n=1 Tax=unclassified Bradyrhizobium TaxID=2631580 RepID=UPI001CD75204|nr:MULTISPECIES: hypothetical protein [unclassified Bradyrhizobium]MCA1361062.1 hypothetical protein [Bradyrhizobium sp. IC4059]MCA1518136.1 hypothetical protein [Bradyrhizobium sp. IC3069]